MLLLIELPRNEIGPKSRNRTDDTRVFSAVLYYLSYLGMKWRSV